MGIKKARMSKMIRLKMLRFYQKFLSPLKPACCRFYPSCSEYALWQFEKRNFFLAFFYTFLRILRCNPYFRGGFDYPKIAKKFSTKTLCFKPIFLAKKQLHFLYIPYKNKEFYIIKIIFKRTISE